MYPPSSRHTMRNNNNFNDFPVQSYSCEGPIQRLDPTVDLRSRHLHGGLLICTYLPSSISGGSNGEMLHTRLSALCGPLVPPCVRPPVRRLEDIFRKCMKAFGSLFSFLSFSISRDTMERSGRRAPSDRALKKAPSTTPLLYSYLCPRPPILLRPRLNIAYREDMEKKEASSKNIRTCRLVMNCILEMLLERKKLEKWVNT